MLNTVTPDNKLKTKTFENMETLDKEILRKKNLMKNLIHTSKPEMSKYEDLFKEFDAKKIHSSVTNRKLVTELCKLNAEEQDPFYIIDLTQIIKQYLQWTKHLPRVHPFYAVKCNPDHSLLRTIQYMGGHFDCASRAEIEVLLNMGVDPKTQIIFANPCKQISHIKYARDVGVTMTTIDNEAELYKIKTHWPGAEVVIRIGVDDSHSLCRFSSKFGASLEACETLVKVCKELELNLVGVSFHVGSGCYDVASFKKAIQGAHDVFKMAEKEGYNLTLLDIGGGWPGTNDVKPTFQDIAIAIRPLLDELFPEGKVKIIAEPGRYFAAASHTMVCNVFAKRHMPDNAKLGEPEYLYYINDGLYGSFNCLYFDHAKITIKTVTFGKRSKKKHLSTIFGPTCDALDKVAEKVEMPELELGDWVYVPNFGAYSTAAASAFNGFKTVKRYFVWRN